MKQTQKLSRIVIALMAISHDRIDYPTGSIFKVPEKDVVFLKMAKCVRDPTDDELKAYEERQTLATVTATQPDDTDHAGLQPQPPSDSEPDAPQSKVVKVIAVDPEAVQTETIGSVKMPPAETVEAAEPVETENVEPKAVTNPYAGWLKKDLNAELDKRGIDHDATATNDTLEALLIEDDAVQVKAAE